MAARFRVSVEEARSAIREARDLQQARPTPTSEADAVELDAVAGRIRAQGARRMGRHVSVDRDVRRGCRDLVVPDDAAHPARGDRRAGSAAATACAGAWASARTTRSGTGLTCLLAGKSGTGKTFAARCLAAELGLNLYRIDLSQVVSKYIGETEKALAQVFDEVEAGHGLLLFDEADALFGRRSEVKDAHDRYANIEVGYLLQRLESYDGIAVLTTNLQGNMDAAFVRRLRFILHFPAPDRELRRRLWERSLPGAEWRDDDLELDVLADRFQLNGGAIHNIGLAAAHLAAATESGRITSAHVVRATQRELQKTGRPSDAAAFGPLGRSRQRQRGAPMTGRDPCACGSTTSPSSSTRGAARRRGRGDAAHGARAAGLAAGGRAARRRQARRRCGRSSCSSSGPSRPTGSPARAPPRGSPTSSTSGSWGRPRERRRAQLPARRVHRLRARRLSGPASA